MVSCVRAFEVLPPSTWHSGVHFRSPKLSLGFEFLKSAWICKKALKLAFICPCHLCQIWPHYGTGSLAKKVKKICLQKFLDTLVFACIIWVSFKRSLESYCGRSMIKMLRPIQRLKVIVAGASGSCSGHYNFPGWAGAPLCYLDGGSTIKFFYIYGPQFFELWQNWLS